MSDVRFKLYGEAYNALTYLELAATDEVTLHTSQSGEDVTLYRLLQGQVQGFYVDVGAFHPVRYSNTFLLHKIFGWRGINIDASEDAIKLFNKMRPQDINLHLAISDVETDVVYSKFKKFQAVNTISESQMEDQVARGGEIETRILMRTHRLETILDQYVPEGEKIDLLNVDVEGVDLQVLKSNNWDKYRPKIVLVEDFEVLKSGNPNTTDIYNFMIGLGYQFVSHLYDTTVYALPEIVERSVNWVRGKVQPRRPNFHYQYGRSEEIDQRIDTIFKQYPPLTNLNKQLQKLQDEKKLIIEQSQNNLIVLMREQDGLRSDYERIKGQLEEANQHQKKVLQDFYNKSQAYDDLQTENKQLSYEIQHHKSKIGLIEAEKEQYLDQIEELTSRISLIKAEKEQCLEQIEELTSKISLIEAEKEQVLEDNHEEFSRLQGMSNIFDMGSIPDDLMQIFIEGVRYTNQRLKDDIQKQQRELNNILQGIEHENARTNNITSATKAILDSRSFRYVNWLKNKIAPRLYPELYVSTETSEPVEAPAILPIETSKPIQPTAPTNELRHIAESRKYVFLKPHQIRLLTIRLYTLGFVERALSELHYNLQHPTSPYVRGMVAWELALWYSQFRDENHAQQVINYLEIAKNNLRELAQIQRIALLEGMSYLILNKPERAKRIVTKCMEQYGVEQNLMLVLVNCAETFEEKLEVINQVLKLNQLEPIDLDEGYENALTLYDRLVYNKPVASLKFYKSSKPQPKVSVIITVYNSADFLPTAMKTILNQTWTNLEVFVVDDCSTDNTADVIQSFCAIDSRVTYLKTDKNSGTMYARNIALQRCTGDFVTCLDADDWSHPQKIEVQVVHLLNNPDSIANMSRQARLTNEFEFYRRPRNGVIIHINTSALMFRRQEVLEKIGYWDTVRAFSDSEYVKRLRHVFGPKSVADVENSLVSFQRQSSGSLTTHSVFGFSGYVFGVNREYEEQVNYFYNTAPSVYMGFPLERRPFVAPLPLLPERSPDNPVRHFDVILISEFRIPGGTIESNIEEIKAQVQAGMKTGIIPLYRYILGPDRYFEPKVRDYIDGENVEVLVYGEKVTCDTLIIRHPPILQEWQRFLPDIEAKNVRVIINQVPYRDYSETGERIYDIRDCAINLKRYFDTTGIWHPIGPVVRNVLLEHHQEELKSINLSHDDWFNIINVEEWRRLSRPPKTNRLPRIGRHSRDQFVKWPEDAEVLRKIYPDTPNYEVHVLGGAQSVADVLGEIPSNWHVFGFDSIHPREFLATLDVFIYYTHTALFEAFGRVIFEAMAVGVPVILPYMYQELFQDAALYAEPSEVLPLVDRLISDDKFYDDQVTRAFKYVEKRFSYSEHIRRLREGFPSDKKFQ